MNKAKTSTVQPTPNSIEICFCQKQARNKPLSQHKSSQIHQGEHSQKAMYNSSQVSNYVLHSAETLTKPATPQQQGNQGNTYHKNGT
jgi:hypothetical protein